MWEILDETDPIGPTRYWTEPWVGRGGGVAVMAQIERNKPWRLGVYPTLDEAKEAAEQWIAARQAERAHRTAAEAEAEAEAEAKAEAKAEAEAEAK